MYTETRHDGFGDEVKRRILIGTYALSSGYYDAYYGRAQKVRTLIAARVHRRSSRTSTSSITPTSPTVAFELGVQDRRPARDVPQRLLHRPDVARRASRRSRSRAGSREGLPVGLQLAGPAFSENRILDAAHALEGALGFDGSPARGGGGMTDVAYEPVIGLEIHVQLRTRTKMFCSLPAELRRAAEHAHLPGLPRACPGTLPVTNAEAIHYGLMIGMAVGSELAPRSIFHRKNYFYPDLPKGYQISQFDEPLCSGGRLGDVRIHRVHLEEDAAKLTHVGASGRSASALGG